MHFIALIFYNSSYFFHPHKEKSFAKQSRGGEE